MAFPFISVGQNLIFDSVVIPFGSFGVVFVALLARLLVFPGLKMLVCDDVKRKERVCHKVFMLPSKK